MRPEKATIVSTLQETLDSSSFLMLIDYTGLTVDQFSEFRGRLQSAGAQCRVVKNSFVKRAAKEAGMPDLSAALTGQTAMLFGEGDVCAAAKCVKTFASEFDKPQFKLGVLDGGLLDPSEIQALADLPPRDILLAQLLGVLQAPAAKLVRTLNEPAASFARLLKAKSEQSGD